MSNLERLQTRIEATRPLQTTVFLMSHDEKLSLVKERKWGNRGDWNNWFDPSSGWNYDLHDAVLSILKSDAKGDVAKLNILNQSNS